MDKVTNPSKYNRVHIKANCLHLLDNLSKLNSNKNMPIDLMLLRKKLFQDYESVTSLKSKLHGEAGLVETVNLETKLLNILLLYKSSKSTLIITWKTK